MRFGAGLDHVRWARQATCLLLRDAAARLYEETRAADVLLFNTDAAPRPAACLDYHARQLVRYAQHGKATFYGRRTPAAAMEPISRNHLWSGCYDNDMSSWIAANGTTFTELSLRNNDLRQVIRLVKHSLKGHDALQEWCRQHAPANSNWRD